MEVEHDCSVIDSFFFVDRRWMMGGSRHSQKRTVRGTGRMREGGQSRQRGRGKERNRVPSLAGTIAAVVLLVAFGVGAYWNSLDGPFVFDDQIAIVQNPMIRQLLPVEDFFASSQPLTDFTLAINYVIDGLNPRRYRLFNLCIHITAALVLFGIVRRTIWKLDGHTVAMIGAERRSFEQGSPYCEDAAATNLPRAVFMAFAIALIWLVHPLQTESVTYVIQRCESMMGLFYLLTLYAVIRTDAAARPQRWMMAAVIFCAAGMASKAVMVTAPVVVLLYDRTFLAGSIAAAIRQRWPLYCGLAATWLVLAGLGVFSGVIAESSDTATVGFGYKGVTPLEYLQTQPGVILHYLRLAFWPTGQCLDYGWQVASTGLSIWGPAILVTVLVVACIWGTWRRSAAGYAGAWFFIILLPTSSFVPIKDLAFEHRMYLPLAGVVGAAVWFVAVTWRLFARSGVVTGGFPERVRGFVSVGDGRPIKIGRYTATELSAAGVLLCIAAALTTLTIRRNALYADPVALWTQTAERSLAPARSHNALGYELLSRGETKAAIEQFERALFLDSSFLAARENLGKALLLDGRVAEAAQAFREAIELAPGKVRAESYFAYGAALMQLGRIEEAIEPLRRAISLRSNYEQAYFYLGNALWMAGSRDSAVGVYQELLRLSPGYTEARVNLGLVLAELGRVDEAITTYGEAIRRFSGGSKDALVKAHYNLGLSLKFAGRVEEAAGQFRAALRIDPRHRASGEELGAMGQADGSRGD